MAWEYDKVIQELQESMTVVVGIQARQAEILKDQSHWLESLQRGYHLHEKRMAHVDERLAGISDKLDGLIGYLDNQRRDNPRA